MTSTVRLKSPRSALTPAGPGIAKCPTGIAGFDQVTDGGLPRGRPTLVCGSAGCGKTLFSVEFLVRGAQAGEPGVFVAFEEREQELVQNVASLGFDLEDLKRRGLLVIDHVRVERAEIEETGEYDLEGLFVRLGHAIDSIKATRVVLDTVETVFSGFSNQAVLRNELRRLFMWLKEKGVTAIVTGERGDGSVTRHGLEEYVSDCVVLLDHRVINQISTRRLRIVKYRGSTHGTNEYPFLIDDGGFSVLPVTSAGLAHKAGTQRISSGIADLDEMLDVKGFFRGASVLISGTAGTGKSTIAAHFAHAVCGRGERCLYCAFEESTDQIVRNMKSVGVDLEAHLKSGRLRILAARPTVYGLETHLAVMHREVEAFKPGAAVFDPLTSLIDAGDRGAADTMVLRLVDFLKARAVTSLFTTLVHGESTVEATQVRISSLMDTWICLRDIEIGGERNRGLYVLKSRGMGHSNQLREFQITSSGVKLVDTYLGPEGVLTGSARLTQERREREREIERRRELAARRAVADRRRMVLEARIAALNAELVSLKSNAETARDQVAESTDFERRERELMSASRRVRLNGEAGEAARRNRQTRRPS